ncbi:Caspase domain-containing protein [Desulfonema limicola]|uniref:Caspase domain-containing protein n=1 Tax=Desulfonema limicola TaxID=45656 RepID=A0A975GHR6_9BACT|nr:caspase family protein [Desulfonema limicola]QTA81629.1 Caspase domain-containing protein [Desulfonema limicola]
MFLSRNSFLILFLIILTLTSCQTRYQQPDEKEPGQHGVTKGLFRHKWWNYYERGLSFSDGQVWQKADADFLQAIKKRNKDQFRARTYGMHFVDYFPHRELGISMFYQERWKEAVKELETSLSSQKTAKAEYYLDKARKSWIEQEKSDINPPSVSIQSPEQGFLSNQFTLSITGTAKDDTYVKSIRVNNVPVRLDVSAKEIVFKTDISLKPGENEIIIKAADITGKTGTAVHKIICDRASPILNVDHIIPDNESETGYTIKGYAYDDSGIKSIRVNNMEIIKKPGKQILLNTAVPVPHENRRYIVTAEDILGNLVKAEIPVSIEQSDLYQHEPEPVLLASLNTFPMILKSAQKKEKSEIYSPLPSSFYLAAGGINVSERQLKWNIKKMIKKGINYALVIGINSYSIWPPLKTAVNDAMGLSEILISRYGFLKENVVIKTEEQATRQEIINDLRNLAAGLGEDDNLLVYFAGHGQLDDLTSDGYWIPVEGELNDPTGWIVNSTIKNILSSEKIRGKNIVVIADSCYSGNLLRGGGKMISASDRNYMMRIIESAQKKSRQIITSGGNEPVADEGRDNHSLFAYYFLKALEDNQSSVIDIESLMLTDVWKSVSEKGGQRPRVGRLKTPMDENGQFVLILNDEIDKQNETELDQYADISFQDAEDSDADRQNKTDRAVPLKINAPKPQDLPDTEPPEINLKDYKQERVVFLDKIYIQGNAKDQGNIQNLTINDKKVLRMPGRNVWFNHLADLDEGRNEFLIKCTDAVGNISEKKIVIERKIPKVFDLDARMSVALFPFARKRSSGTGVHKSLLKNLVESGRFNMKEWKSEIIEGLPDQDEKKDEIIKIAKELGVDYVLIGTLDIKEKSLEISARVIEVDSYDILTFEDVYGEDIDRELEEKLCSGLVLKLCDSLPVIEGKIVKLKSDEVIVNIGENHNIKKGMRLIFFKEGEPLKDPDTGEELGADIEELGVARVYKFMGQKMSQAKLLNKDITEELEAGLSFVTQ